MERTAKKIEAINYEAQQFLDAFTRFRFHGINSIDQNLCESLYKVISEIDEFLDSKPKEISIPQRNHLQPNDLKKLGLHRGFICKQCEAELGDSLDSVRDHVASFRHLNPVKKEKSAPKKPKRDSKTLPKSKFDMSYQRWLSEPWVSDEHEKEARSLILGDLKTFFIESMKIADKLKTLREYKEIEDDLLEDIRPHFPNQSIKLYLFGSRIGGMGTINSDLDMFLDIGGVFNIFENRPSSETTDKLQAVKKILDGKNTSSKKGQRGGKVNKADNADNTIKEDKADNATKGDIKDNVETEDAAETSDKSELPDNATETDASKSLEKSEKADEDDNVNKPDSSVKPEKADDKSKPSEGTENADKDNDNINKPDKSDSSLKTEKVDEADNAKNTDKREPVKANTSDSANKADKSKSSDKAAGKADIADKGNKKNHSHQTDKAIKKWDNVVGIQNARVPILKIRHVRTSICIDIGFNNSLGLCNTKLTSYLFELQPLAKAMCLFMKKWFARINAHDITSYSTSLLVIYFLQTRNILPPIKDLQTCIADPVEIGPWIATFAEKSLAELDIQPAFYSLENVKRYLRGFFKFYSTFDFERFVICPYAGCVIPVRNLNFSPIIPRYVTYIQANIDNPDAQFKINYMHVQDPFQLNHNVTKAVAGLSSLKNLFTLSANLFSDSGVQPLDDVEDITV